MTRSRTLIAGAIAILLLGGVAGSLVFSHRSDAPTLRPPREPEASPPAPVPGHRSSPVLPPIVRSNPRTPEASSAPGTPKAPPPAGSGSESKAPRRGKVVTGSIRLAGNAVRTGTVCLKAVGSRTAHRGVVTDGSYRIAEVPAGAYEVTFTPRKGASTLCGVVVVKAGSPETHFDLNLEETVSASGMVVDGKTGKPIRFATVQFSRKHPTGEARQGEGVHVQANAEGAFRATGLVRDWYKVHVFSRGSKAFETDVDLTNGSMTGLRFPLTRSTTTLKVLVREKSGEFYEGRGYVTFKGVGERRSVGGGATFTGTGDPTTIAVIVDPGVYDVEFRTYGNPARSTAPVRVTIRDGENGPVSLTLR